MKLLRLVNRNNVLYRLVDIIIMTFLTALSIYNEQATVFYIIYLFWWHEFLSFVINSFFDKLYKRKKEVVPNNSTSFLLTIYLIFIIVIFGIIANWNNQDAVITNLGVMFFKNLYFNINLLFIITEICFYNIQNNHKIPAQANSGFTANMIVLHISIILGAFALFFVVRKFPEIFTTENTWASLLIISPFLLLRFIVQMYRLKNS